MAALEIFKNKALINDIPQEPGVYIMRSADNEILYIGKAKKLKNRIKSYLNENNLDIFKLSMVKEAALLEFIVVKSELDALLLESNLIKKHRPPYNVVFRDDKSYPYLCISLSEKYPRIFSTRSVRNKNDFYFGPITPVEKLHNLIKILKSSYKIIQKNSKNCQHSKTACIYYQMGKCSAPCIGRISESDYRAMIEEIKQLLINPSRIKKNIKAKLSDYIKNEDYENAIIARDKLKAVSVLEDKQIVSSLGDKFVDVIAFEKKGIVICVYIINIRFSNIVGNRSFFFYNLELDDNFKEEFIIQYYFEKNEIIPDIILSQYFSSKDIVSKILSGKSKSVKIIFPKKGHNKGILHMAAKNATLEIEAHLKKFEKQLEVLEKIKILFNLKNLPYIIDVVDISHISFENVVSGVVRYEFGGFNRAMYRRYSLDSHFEKDAMEETAKRHKKLLLKSASRLPNLVLVDGGLIQVNAFYSSFGVKTIGIAKEKRNNISVRNMGDVQDSVYYENGIVEVDEDVLQFLQMLRDESHRFAVNYHRKKREQSVISSALDRVKFIGQKRKKLLFDKFVNIENIKNADISEISSIKGISVKAAKAIKEILNN